MFKQPDKQHRDSECQLFQKDGESQQTAGPVPFDLLEIVRDRVVAADSVANRLRHKYQRGLWTMNGLYSCGVSSLNRLSPTGFRKNPVENCQAIALFR